MICVVLNMLKVDDKDISKTSIDEFLVSLLLTSNIYDRAFCGYS